MSNNKSMSDRIAAIQLHCLEEQICLGLTFDPTDLTWTAWDETITEELTEPAALFDEMIEALEAHFEL